MANSVYGIFEDAVKSRGDKVAAQYKVNGAWRDVTWGEMHKSANEIGSALLELGVEAKEHVSILSNTRLEWVICDLGIQATGAATVPIYQSNLAEECEYILTDSKAIVVFAEDESQLKKLREIKDKIPAVRKVICLEEGKAEGDWEIGFEDFLKGGRDALEKNQKIIDERTASLGPDDILTMIYTSGTTGKPKGVVITHDAMLYEAEGVHKINLITPDDVQYFWMPMAHVFAKVLEVVWLKEKHIMAFWEGDVKKIVPNCAEVRPTMMCSVPRIFEKVHASVTGKVADTPGVKGKLGRWALKKGEEAAKLEHAGKDPSSLGFSFRAALPFQKTSPISSNTRGSKSVKVMGSQKPAQRRRSVVPMTFASEQLANPCLAPKCESPATVRS